MHILYSPEWNKKIVINCEFLSGHAIDENRQMRRAMNSVFPEYNDRFYGYINLLGGQRKW